MSLTAHFLVLACSIAILGLPRGTAAQAEPGKAAATQYEPESRQLLSSKEEQRHGLQAARLSVTIASINVPKLAIWGSIWLLIARDESDPALRRRLYAIGPLQLAGAAANVTWLFFSGQSLRDYKHDGRKWMTVRRARLDTAFSGVDTALLIPGIVGGSIALVRNRDEKSSLNRMTGLVFLVPNLALLPFHIWALVANGSELKHRKRGGELARARRLQPITSGFRF